MTKTEVLLLSKLTRLCRLPERLYCKIPIKACPSFDNGLVYEGVDQPVTDSINALFNTDPNDLTGWSHFEMNLGQTVAAANETIGSEYFKSAKGSFEISAEAQKHIAMYNPMYYIQDYSGVASEGLSINSYADDLYQSSDVAPYWCLRVGKLGSPCLIFHRDNLQSCFK